jgi:hypothetical protein
VAPPLTSKMWVENKGGESRREPPGGFRPQTLPLWECVGRTGPRAEQLRRLSLPPSPELKGQAY